MSDEILDVAEIQARLRREVVEVALRLASIPLPGDSAETLRRSFKRTETEERAAAKAAKKGRRAAPADDHPIDRLRNALDLDDTDLSLVVLAAMPEEHEALAQALRLVHGRGEGRATVGLALRVLAADDDRATVRERLELGAVVTSGTIRVAASAPLDERSLELADGLWLALLGLDVWPQGASVDLSAVAMAGVEKWVERPEVRRARAAIEQGSTCTVVVRAVDEGAALHRAAAIVHAAEGVAARIRGSKLQDRAIALHAAARGVVPVVAASALDPAAASFAACRGPVVIAVAEGVALAANGARPTLTVDAGRMSSTERIAMWSELVDDDVAARELGQRYNVEPSVALEVRADAELHRELEGRAPGLDTLASMVRARAGVAHAQGLKLVHPRARKEDLVLPDDRKAHVLDAVTRLSHRATVFDDWGLLDGHGSARGVKMLFAGPPGTGKTMSAEVLAFELGVELLVVDIARVVSKWIGETEKNLAEVFDAAERSQAVLLFDEADALFGARTKVSDAHDRYANLETAFLLSRIERFDGLVVLSTNLRQNVDPAFMRRLDYVVDFEEPGAAERRAIWERHLAQAPRAKSLDLGEIASFYPLVGGLIRNAALAAAFSAAAGKKSIEMDHVVEAVRREYEKAGRAFPGKPDAPER